MNTLFNLVFGGVNFDLYLNEPKYVSKLLTESRKSALLDQYRTVTSISDADYKKFKEKCKALNIEVIEDLK